MNLNEDQYNALEQVGAFLDDPDDKVMSIIGPPGTGKTFLIEQIKKKFSDVLLHATTNQAAMLINGNTIHSRMGYGIRNIREYKSKLEYNNPVLIDEGSMMPESIMFDLKHNYSNKVILVGDKNQLTVGNNVNLLDYPFVELTINMRAKSEALKRLSEELSDAVETQTLPDLKKYVGEHLTVIKDFKQFISLINECEVDHQVLAYRNNIVDKYKELTGKGMTVYKAQGKTYDTVFIDHRDIHSAYTQIKNQFNNPISLDKYLRMTLVGFTRAQHKIIVFYGTSRT